jgi:Asp-tRNA(Asn)/Glu-tRNA(Gln) amidotransferase A subunit family amidase
VELIEKANVFVKGNKGRGSHGILAFTKCYQDGTTNPTRVISAALLAQEALECGKSALDIFSDIHVPTNMRTFTQVHHREILKAALESTRRWKAGNQLSALDGVPFAVKEEADVQVSRRGIFFYFFCYIAAS